jgi:sugar phosphate isomerase/epimerase
MVRPRVIPSTTSHKHEAILPTLDVFARLGMRDLDLNLNHIVERHVPVEAIERALAANGQRVWTVSGGWCDFFDAPPTSAETDASVERQVVLARRFGVHHLRLFFGRLEIDACTPAAIARAAGNIRRLADAHPDVLFAFENHDGASSRPAVCRAILEAVDRPNVRLNFDPINFEFRGVTSAEALDVLRPFIAHVHLKGLDDERRFCGFGDGAIDLVPSMRSLIEGGYDGAFTVEYEGPFDRTVRLYESLRCATETIADLSSSANGGDGANGKHREAE